MDKQKEILIEQSANLYKSIGYPRIAGKIMGLLYVSEQKHFTFQELMDTLNISKGATSTALNFLIEIKEIDFITKADNKRKRYFYISEKGTITSLQDWLRSLFIRKELLEQILSVRNDTNPKLDNLIKQQIAFIKEIAPFIEDKIKEHFK